MMILKKSRFKMLSFINYNICLRIVGPFNMYDLYFETLLPRVDACAQIVRPERY